MPLFRHRHRAALLAAGLIASAPLLAVAPASADPVVESGRQVTFSGGGLLGVSCASNPHTGSVTIAAETSLRVVNRTGHRATLMLDGSARGEIAGGSTAEVLFHRGPVSLSLKPHCVLPQQRAVRVQVVAARPADEKPPAAVPDRPVPPSGGDSSPDESPWDGSGDAGMGQAPPRSDRPRAERPGGGTGSGAWRDRDSTTRERAGQEDPAGDPTRGPVEETPEPVSGDGVDASAEPDDGPMDVTGTGDLPAGGNGTGDGGGLAAEPMASVEPITNKGPTGLLALIAIVCVLGAIAGAMRAIMAQRASRASIA